jgi:antitoxin FitA
VAPIRRYCAAVPSVQIKGVPDDVHAELRRRAADAGQSLQEYLLGRLTEEARTPSLPDLLDRVGRRRGGRFSLQDAADAVRDERDAR